MERMRNFLLCCFFTQCLLFSNYVHAEDNQLILSDFYAHEYVCIAISYYKTSCWPESFFIMTEPSDTLVLNMNDMESFVHGLYKNSLKYEQLNDYRVFGNIYGPNNDTYQGYIFFISGEFNSYLDSFDKITYTLKDKTVVNLSYMKVTGIFVNYKSSYVDIPQIDEEIVDNTCVCPVSILMCEKAKDLNITLNYD